MQCISLVAGIHYMSRFGLLFNCSAVVQTVKVGLTTWISLILNERVIALTEKTEKIGCIISITSIYNIVVTDNFDFNYFQIDVDFGIFLRAHKVILIKRLLYIST